jgi:hypothetical protein
LVKTADCSNECARRASADRSLKWTAERRAAARANRTCAVCGKEIEAKRSTRHLFSEVSGRFA